MKYPYKVDLINAAQKDSDRVFDFTNEPIRFYAKFEDKKLTELYIIITEEDDIPDYSIDKWND